MQINFTILLELLVTFAFAVSGMRQAAGKQIDWYGAYILGLVTAVGGGTLRDLLLGVTPFWILDGKYFLTTAVALVTILLFKQSLLRWGSTLFLFDTLGLGLFTVVGISISIDEGLPFWVCIIMGTITGTVGGVIRDVLLNQVPLLFREDIYALACVGGGAIYFICRYVNLPEGLIELIAALTVIVFRLIAVKYNVNLPQLQSIDTKASQR